MLKKYEVRVKEDNGISRKYTSSVAKLSDLLREIAAKDVIGVYRLKFSDETVSESEKLDWRFKGNILSLTTVDKNKNKIPLDTDYKRFEKEDPLKDNILIDRNARPFLFRHTKMAGQPSPRLKPIVRSSPVSSSSESFSPSRNSKSKSTGLRSSRTKLNSTTRARKTKRG